MRNSVSRMFAPSTHLSTRGKSGESTSEKSWRINFRLPALSLVCFHSRNITTVHHINFMYTSEAHHIDVGSWRTSGRRWCARRARPGIRPKYRSITCLCTEQLLISSTKITRLIRQAHCVACSWRTSMVREACTGCRAFSFSPLESGVSLKSRIWCIRLHE